MTRRRVLGVLALLLFAGCATPDAPPGAEGPSASTPCEHPWPCADGSEWPRELVGPFERGEAQRVAIESHDGVVLNAWVTLPQTPEGVRLPAVLHSTPYVGQERGSPEGTDFWETASAGVPFTRIVEEGYALVVAQVRGTGNSGGCFDMVGPDEQADQAVLVDWIAAQEWSSGRVGMVGLSYHGGTPWEAAIHAPPALKTVVVAGTMTDIYTMLHSPNGAVRDLGWEQFVLVKETVPPSPLLDVDRSLEWSAVAGERACPEVVEAFGRSTQGAFADDRDAGFWAPRRLLGSFPNITAAVLLTGGFHDNRIHGYQDDPVWDALPSTTPRSALLGQWDHEWPSTNHYRTEWTYDAWDERELRWLDFWLKGLGSPPAELGRVDHQDDAGTWRNATSWPPREATSRALHLAGDALASRPGDGATSFESSPDPTRSAAADETVGYGGGESPGPMCPDPLPLGTPRFASFVSEPLDKDLVLAGRAFAALTLRASEEGGIVHATLVDLAPEFACDPRGVPTGARWVSGGAADLRYHSGNYAAEPFPVGTPTLVRVDFLDLSAFIPAGHRVGLFLSGGDATFLRHQAPDAPDSRLVSALSPDRYQPTIGIEPQSHLVLPVLEGEIGIEPPLAEYPPRPFTV